MNTPYVTLKIEHATVNVYVDHDYSDQYDDIDIKAAIHDGRYHPSIIEVIVYDTTGNVTGMDLLGGCLIEELLDVHTVVAENDMIPNANDDLKGKLTRIVQIYNHLK